jgi:uncharacterized membrane protein (Fun14 family)
MNDHILSGNSTMEDQSHLTPHAKTFVNWLLAVLGIGSAVDLVPIVVGVFSVAWLVIQAYGYVTIDMPNKRLDRENKKLDQEIKRAKLAAVLRGIADADEALAQEMRL